MPACKTRPVAAATSAGPTAVERLHALLAAAMPMKAWRTVLAASAGLLTYTCTCGGLFLKGSWLQTSLLTGITVGLIAPDIVAAAAVGALVGLLGSLVGPDFFWLPVPDPTVRLQALMGSMAVGSAIAVVVRAGLSKGRLAATSWLLVGVALLIGNLWYTSLTINSQQLRSTDGVMQPSLNEQLDGKTRTRDERADAVLFRDVLLKMEEGESFYDAYAEVLTAARGGVSSILDFRTPLPYLLFLLLPSHLLIVPSFLVLATLSIGAVFLTNAGSVKLPLILPATAALASFFLYCATLLGGVMGNDNWAAALGVIALGAHARSLTAEKWRPWCVLAVALSALAVLTREIMALLLIGGLVAAFLGDPEQRRFRIRAWSSGLVLFAVLYAVHFMAARPYLLGASGVPRSGKGSVAFMLAAFDFGTRFLGSGGSLPWVLAVLGIVGVLAFPDSRMRGLMLIAVFVPALSFLVLGNDARVPAADGGWQYDNYWGLAFEPLLYAMLPTAFALIPGARARKQPRT